MGGAARPFDGVAMEMLHPTLTLTLTLTPTPTPTLTLTL